MMIDERHRDYSLFFQSPLVANAALPAQQLRIDSDGPFSLREIGFAGLGGVLPQSITVKFTDDIGRFVEQDYVPTFGEIPNSGAALTNFNGLLPVFTPVLPQIVYPPNATIVVYIQNTNPAQSLTGGVMTFRGSTLHPKGTILNAAAYPKHFREVPFSYVAQVVQFQTTQLDNIQNILPDADFALRAALMTPVALASLPLQSESAAHMLFTSVVFGPSGTGITINLTSPSPAANQPLTITVNLVTKTITVIGATNASGTLTTTGNQLAAALNANAAAASLVFTTVTQGGTLVFPVLSGTTGTIVIDSMLGSDWRIQLKDQNGKYYQTGSNKTGSGLAHLVEGGVFPDSIMGHLTPFEPGIFEPEIYLPRNGTLYFDVQAPTAPISYIIRWIGAKIFQSDTPC